MMNPLRFLVAAFAAAVGLSAQAAHDFVGVYEFSSTTTVLNSMNNWEQCAVSDFTFSVDVNKGEDAATYPYIVKNFLPQKDHPYGMEVANLKAQLTEDGNSLAIIAGDEGILLDKVPHLCAWSGGGKEAGNGKILLTYNGSGYTMNDIVITWHQKIDMGFFVDDTAKDLVQYSSIKITKAEAGAVDFTGTYALTSTKEILDDRFAQGYWLMPEFTFTITPNDGRFEEKFEFMVHGFMTLNQGNEIPSDEEETTEGEGEDDTVDEGTVDEGEGEGGEGDEPTEPSITMTQSVPAYLTPDGQSLVLSLGEDHHLLEGGTHFCAWGGREGKAGGKNEVTMSLAGDGQGYVFNEEICICYHNLIYFGDFLFADECYPAACLTDIYVEKLSSEVTAIQQPAVVPASHTTGIAYDLTGRALNPAKAHGLFIKGGKKVLMH